jgi:hypothetical protein
MRDGHRRTRRSWHGWPKPSRLDFHKSSASQTRLRQQWDWEPMTFPRLSPIFRSLEGRVRRRKNGRKLFEAVPSRVFAPAAAGTGPEGTRRANGNRGRFLLPPFLYRHKEKEVAIQAKPKASIRQHEDPDRLPTRWEFSAFQMGPRPMPPLPFCVPKKVSQKGHPLTGPPNTGGYPPCRLGSGSGKNSLRSDSLPLFFPHPRRHSGCVNNGGWKSQSSKDFFPHFPFAGGPAPEAGKRAQTV